MALCIPIMSGDYVGGVRAGAASTTWNPSDANSLITLANGNRDATYNGGGGVWAGVRSTTSKSSGQWYFEVKILTQEADGLGTLWGVADATTAAASLQYPGQYSNSEGTRMDFSAGSGFTDAANHPGGQLAVNDICQCAIDFAQKALWFGRNNTWFGGSTPSTSVTTGNAATWASNYTLFIAVGLVFNTNSARLNVTAGQCSFSPPSGFTVWG